METVNLAVVRRVLLGRRASAGSLVEKLLWLCRRRWANRGCRTVPTSPTHLRTTHPAWRPVRTATERWSHCVAFARAGTQTRGGLRWVVYVFCHTVSWVGDSQAW